LYKQVKEFIIRNFPVQVRQALVRLRNIGRNIPTEAHINGCSYTVIPHVFWLKYNKGDWEPDLCSFFKKYITENSSILDIGGWQGASLFAAHSCGPQNVIVVEANPDTFAILKKNCEMNRLEPATELYQLCLSDTSNRTAEFGPMDNHLVHTAIHGIGGKGYELQAVAFTDFLKKLDFDQIQIVKIDIEGGERFFSDGFQYLSKISGLYIFLALHPPFWDNKRRVANNLLKVFDKFEIYNSKEQPLSLKDLESLMLSESKTQYPSKTGPFFDIILKSTSSDSR